MKQTKCVIYSYPTSTNAERFGFGKAGCYTVETGIWRKPFKAVAGFATFEQARVFAESLAFPWLEQTLTPTTKARNETDLH